jgi:peroxiredoxin
MNMNKTEENLTTSIRWALTVLIVLAFSVNASAQQIGTQAEEVPVFLQEFIIFYSSGELDKMPRYIHPERGFIQNGILLTHEEVEKEFRALGLEIGKIEYIKLYFQEGFFPGENYYRAKCTVEYRAAGYTQTIPTVFVFEKIDDTWHLVQSERVEFIEQFRPLDVLTVGYILPDIELETNTGRLYTSKAAADNDKVTLLYFFNLLDLFREENTAFFQSILTEFGPRDDLYIFGVTDETEEYVNNWMTDERIRFVWLKDEESLLHYDLGILTHPMMLLLDREGRLVMMGGWEYDRDRLLEPGYHPPAHDLIKERIRDVLSESPVSE